MYGGGCRSAVRRLGLVAVLSFAITAGLAVVNPSATSAVTGTIAGTVFEDFNANGAMDPGSNNSASGSAADVGVKGVMVTVTDSIGSVVTTTTDSAGAFSVPITAATNDVRVAIDAPAGYLPGPQGPHSGTTVQFVDLTAPAAGAVMVGLVRQGNYSPDRPRLLNVLQSAAINGFSRQFVVQSDQPTLVSSDHADRNFAVPTTEATADQTGAIWGVAQVDAAYAFTSAYFKRHTRTGPDGLGAIYLTDLSAGPNASPWAKIPNAGTNPRGDEALMTTFSDWFHDVAAFPFVGKVGLGGTALAPDRKSLYVMNLNSKSLWQVPFTIGTGGVPLAGPPAEVAIPLSLPGAATGCPSQSDLRPFGVSAQNGSIWVTLTCTGPAVADLRGYVYRYSPEAGTFDAAPAFETALSGYARGATFRPPPFSANWNPWEDVTWPGSQGIVSKPQPMVSDVTFDSSGDMTIGIKDRLGDQAGHGTGDLTPGSPQAWFGMPGGDILRACRNAADTGWELESNGSCGAPPRLGARPTNNQGPGGGEFYNDDFVPYHDQVSLGALLQLPGYGEVINTSFDPGKTTNAEGVRFYSHANGAPNSYHLIRGNPSSTSGGFAKSGGLGDMAALVGAAPLEIGNRVWLDTDGDGIQDAGEPPIPGVTVSLYAADGATLLATAVTDVTGTYYFSNAAGTSSTSVIFGVTGLQPGTDYVVRIDNPPDYAPGGPLAGLRPTAAGAGPDRSVDSDGSPVSGFAEAAITTEGEAASDHTIDFGFVRPASVGDFVWEDLNGDGLQTAGEPGILGVTVRLFQGATEVAATVTDGSGRYLFAGLAAGTYRVRFESPGGFTPTIQDAGGDDAVDSDASSATGETVDFSLSPGENDLSWDAGFIRPPPPTTPGPGKTTTTQPLPAATTVVPRAVLGFPLSKTGTDIAGPLNFAAALVVVGGALTFAGRPHRSVSPRGRRRARRAAFEDWLHSAELREVKSFIDRL
jgi:hypothetical protein